MMGIRELRARLMMEMLMAKSGSALEKLKLEQIRAVDRVWLCAKEDHEELLETEYGYTLPMKK